MTLRYAFAALLLAAALPALATPATTVKTTTVATERIATTVTAYGQLIPAPGALEWLSAAHAGRVAAVRVTPGTEVGRTQGVVDIEPTPQSLAALASAKSGVAAAQARLTQVQVLVQGGLATRAELAAAAGSVASARARLAALKAGGAGSGAETVAAPAAGVITAIPVARGEWVAAGARIAAFVPARALAVRLGLTPEQAAGVRPGAAVRIVPVFAAGKSLASRVATVARQASASTGLIDVEVPVRAGSAGPYVGEWVAGTITLATSKLPVVPRSSVLQDHRGFYVFVVRDGKAHRVDVKPLVRARGLVGVSGLEPGLTVVTQGNFELTDGARVRLAGAGDPGS